uniref:C2H2-type domain-containing protein n=1 Tax=Plectus sambesii TaxID=2011161 RepID=A0A914WM87_9BILA
MDETEPGTSISSSSSTVVFYLSALSSDIHEADKELECLDDSTLNEEASGDADITDEKHRMQRSLEEFAVANAQNHEMGSAQLVCPQCLKQFQQLCNLKQHLRIHSGDRPYSCPLCDKHFKQQGHLQTHLRALHTGERPYSCPIETCTKSFHQLGNLRQHLRAMHGPKDAKPRKVFEYPCDVCGVLCSSKASLKSHHRKVHEAALLEESNTLRPPPSRSSQESINSSLLPTSSASFQLTNCKKKDKTLPTSVNAKRTKVIIINAKNLQERTVELKLNWT